MSDDPVVYLHVGAPKTGTTFVQDRLFRNRESLRERGILYPADRFDAQFVAALDLEGLSWGGLGGVVALPDCQLPMQVHEVCCDPREGLLPASW